MLKHAMPKCFAYHRGDCKVLITRDCLKCKFYKTAEELQKERKRCAERIRYIYGADFDYVKYILKKGQMK